MPIYIYNPHEWFMVARRESERILFDKITASGRKLYVTVGTTTAVDRVLKKEFDGTLAQYHATDTILFEKRNYYLNIFGDFIIEAWLDESVTKKLDALYRTATTLDEAFVQSIKSIIAEEGKNKLVISRNAKKAEKLKRLFNGYFF